MSPVDEELVLLETPLLRLVIDPACGGKLRSLVSRRTGRELFYPDRRKVFDAGRGYSRHDMSGMDECFPAVAACRGRTADGNAYDYADHGSLWQESWETHVADGALEMSCTVPGTRCTFARRAAFAADAELLLEYRLSNAGTSPVPFVYSAHPLLAADKETRVILPAGMTRAFIYVAGPGFAPDRTWMDLPAAHPSDIVGPYRLDRRTYVKLFSDKLTDSRACVEHPASGDRLVVTFDTTSLPHLGFLACQGWDSLGDGYFTRQFLLALEPTTSIGDDLATAEAQGSLAVLLPGQERTFWIRWSLERM